MFHVSYKLVSGQEDQRTNFHSHMTNELVLISRLHLPPSLKSSIGRWLSKSALLFHDTVLYTHFQLSYLFHWPQEPKSPQLCWWMMQLHNLLFGNFLPSPCKFHYKYIRINTCTALSKFQQSLLAIQLIVFMKSCRRQNSFLSIWLHQVLVVACGSFVWCTDSSCSLWAQQLWCASLVALRHVGYQFLHQVLNLHPLHCKVVS